jgi:8-oxo-dGTP diphosphatase
MKMIPELKVLPPCSVDDSELTYVVMGARYREQWIFVRHHQRQTWELPAGHIEADEDPDRAAARELYEEAGVIDPKLSVVSDYSVKLHESCAYGRLYFAEVKHLGPLPDHEIEEIQLCRELPLHLSYPQVQPLLFSLLTSL